jgi:hypothetical protein
VLTSEHRAAPAAPPVHLELVATDAATTHLEVVEDPVDGSTPLSDDGPRRSLEQRVLELLSPGAPVTRAKLRDSLGVKNQRLGGPGVAGASWPAMPHARRLATSGGIDRTGRSRSPSRDDRERNGRTSPESGCPANEAEPCQGLTSSAFALW